MAPMADRRAYAVAKRALQPEFQVSDMNTTEASGRELAMQRGASSLGRGGFRSTPSTSRACAGAGM